LETIVLLDDAHEGSREVLEHVARLAEADRGSHSRLTVVLSLASGRAAALETRLLELAELRIDVEPWEEPDTLGYLNWSLAQAGRKTSAFSEEAMIRLHVLSDGIPRRVNQLAGLALVAGAARQIPLIDADTVESIHHELGVIDAAA
jgi:general secretion pathway protein A